jgi:adenylate cyclase
MAEDQDATVRTVTAYREEVELLVRQHRGQLVDFTGDNFLAEFASALYAVRCAVEIQSVLRARNTPLAADRRVEFRMGVHLADVQVEGERRFGTGVNVAARLEALAEPGGLCISAPVLEHVRGNLELEFDDLGTQSVKNIPDPVRVYRVKLEAVPPKAAPGSMRRAALVAGVAVLLGVVAVAGWRMFAGDGEAVTGAAISAPIRSIAVLPLENLSGDPEQEYFADGMTEALIGDLAKIGSDRVAQRDLAHLGDALQAERQVAPRDRAGTERRGDPRGHRHACRRSRADHRPVDRLTHRPPPLERPL